MKYLEFIFMGILSMAAIYVIFNIVDFVMTWLGWIRRVGQGLWDLIKWLWKVMKGWIGKK